jgi:hypothetical protein
VPQRAVIGGLGDGEGAVAWVLRLVGMAHHPETDAKRKGDLSHPCLVAQLLGEQLCLTHEPHTPLDLTERVNGVAEVEAEVYRLLDGLAGLREVFGRGEGVLEMGAGIPQRPAQHRLGPRLSRVKQCLVPQLSAQSVMGQSLDLLPQSVAMESLDLLDNPRVDGAPAVSEETAVRHLLRERMLERVLQIGKEACLIQKLRGLQKRELSAHALLGLIGDGVEQNERDVLSNDSRRLQQLLLRC